MNKEWDVFISHASEDKGDFVRPLAEALKQLGVKVWYDDFTLEVGDSLSRSIDMGLANSRYGIVVISPSFMQKKWTERELRGLVAREVEEGQKIILPIWLGVSRHDILTFSPMLADTFAIRARGMDAEDIALSLLKTIRPDLNIRIGEDVINLTSALKGQSKTRGNWGEIILERVLEMSGLVKGRQYELQVNLTTEIGKRSQAEAVVYLPDERHIVIDSKVDLNAYERYYSMSDGTERDAELKLHIAAFRNHVNELIGKRYGEHFKLGSLDFVLMFVPIESAFNLAIGNDNSIYDEAFSRKIVIVTPTTLHATLYAISNSWRQIYQNRNAQEIAREAGALYDMFVGFAEDLENIEKKRNEPNDSYRSEHKKLRSGMENLIKGTETIRALGAKTTKTISNRRLEKVFGETETNAVKPEDSLSGGDEENEIEEIE